MVVVFGDLACGAWVPCLYHGNWATLDPLHQPATFLVEKIWTPGLFHSPCLHHSASEPFQGSVRRAVGPLSKDTVPPTHAPPREPGPQTEQSTLLLW